jgi:hypothetical protein
MSRSSLSDDSGSLGLLAGNSEQEVIRMPYACHTSEDLVDALIHEAGTIEAYAKLGDAVIAIKATGAVAWGVCAGCLAVAITSYIAAIPSGIATGGTGTVAFAVAGTAAAAVPASILGAAITPVLTIGITAGGIGALSTLRDKYKIVEKRKDCIVLERKK